VVFRAGMILATIRTIAWREPRDLHPAERVRISLTDRACAVNCKQRSAHAASGGTQRRWRGQRSHVPKMRATVVGRPRSVELCVCWAAQTAVVGVVGLTEDCVARAERSTKLAAPAPGPLRGPGAGTALLKPAEHPSAAAADLRRRRAALPRAGPCRCAHARPCR